MKKIIAAAIAAFFVFVSCKTGDTYVKKDSETVIESEASDSAEASPDISPDKSEDSKEKLPPVKVTILYARRTLQTIVACSVAWSLTWAPRKQPTGRLTSG